MIICFYALHTDSWWAQEIREGRSPALWVLPSSACQTAEEAWEVCGDRTNYIMVRWEWCGEINNNGCWWSLSNPQLVS